VIKSPPAISPLKKPGAYQLRAAVRDVTTKKLGAANEFIDVQDVKKGKLTLSGVIVRGAEAASAGTPEKEKLTKPRRRPIRQCADFSAAK